jgi:hypothetical protein
MPGFGAKRLNINLHGTLEQIIETYNSERLKDGSFSVTEISTETELIDYIYGKTDIVDFDNEIIREMSVVKVAPHKIIGGNYAQPRPAASDVLIASNDYFIGTKDGYDWYGCTYENSVFQDATVLMIKSELITRRSRTKIKIAVLLSQRAMIDKEIARLLEKEKRTELWNDVS